ncbi:hypothetical protein AJ79_06413 [Helicocarpus griseus UAMH5409]|uniref:3'-5' exonuclease domain-containing protein n=1 Tax=Helicocarpus griseus UAMH5409 TaxID=1447875 RepID=A0A2B7XDE6_9EURO|nr:hypothetical protein AJ79_06413 [Helicocarpus griseus UAMH5409]
MVEDPEFVNTLEGLKSLVDWVARMETWLGNPRPPLYIDIEGERLSRHGRVSLMTVLVYPGDSEFLMRPHIIDIHSLGPAAFSAAGKEGKTFKDILESPQILKVFFDVRNDSDALYAHYGIKLQGVRDIQLMESARRPNTHRRISPGFQNASRKLSLTREKRISGDSAKRLAKPCGILKRAARTVCLMHGHSRAISLSTALVMYCTYQDYISDIAARLSAGTTWLQRRRRSESAFRKRLITNPMAQGGH